MNFNIPGSGLLNAITALNKQMNELVIPSSTLTNLNVVLAGDSITRNCSSATSGTESHGYITHALSEIGQSLKFVDANNYGLGGDTSADLLARFSAVTASDCGLVVIAIGTNDRGGANLTAQQTIDNIQAMVDLSLVAGMKVIVCTPNPRGTATYPNNRLSTAQLANHLQVRRWIISLEQPDVYPCDTWKYLADPLSSTGDIKEDYTSDGLHSIQLGAYWHGKALAEVMEKIAPVVQVLPVTNADQYSVSNLTGAITTNPMMKVTGTGVPGVRASATFTLTGTHSDGQTITIGSTTYTFKTALTSPSVPNEILRHSTNATFVGRIISAINGGSGAGTSYSTGTVTNTQVSAVVGTDTASFVATALNAGTAGNSIAVSDTATNGSWSSATLTGGVNEIPGDLNVIPDDWSNAKATGTTGTTFAYSQVTTATGVWSQVVIGGTAATADAAVDICRQIGIHTKMLPDTAYEGVVEFEVDAGASGIQSLQLGMYVINAQESVLLWDCDRYTAPSVIPTFAFSGTRRTPPVTSLANMTDARLRLSLYLVNGVAPSATIRWRKLEARPVR